MDPKSHLLALGWSGPGHALHPTSGRGLTNPLVIAQKQNVLGLGKKQHDAHADQWWARAFDDVLKSVNTQRDTEGRIEAVKIQDSGVLRAGGKMAVGLYSWFVRGEGLGGTLQEEGKRRDVLESVSASASERKGKRRRERGREELCGDDEVSKGEKEKKQRKKKSGREQQLETMTEVVMVSKDVPDEDHAREKPFRSAQSELNSDLEAKGTEEKGRIRRGERRARKAARREKRLLMPVSDARALEDEEGVERSEKRRRRREEKKLVRILAEIAAGGVTEGAKRPVETEKKKKKNKPKGGVL